MNNSKNPVTLDDVKADIARTDYIHDETLTICIMTCKNGYKIVGQSACHPDYYNKEMGEEIAYKQAIDKLFSIFAYNRLNS